MKSNSLIKLLSLLMMLSLVSPSGNAQRRRGTARRNAPHASLAAKIRRFAPTVVTADATRLAARDRRALEKIIAAAAYMDPLFLRQVWRGNPELKARLEQDNSPAGRERLHYFKIMAGPWSRLDEEEPFITGVGPKPPGAGFYPEDLTKDEFNSWAQGLSEREREHATGFFYVIKRDGGQLRAVPYSEEYREFLEPAAKLLREAAQLTTNRTLRDFLNKRAAAFASNDYYESDVAWMDLDAPIDVTIGPYETYEDGLFGYKAAFEAFVTLRDDAESSKLARFSRYLQELEDHLPIDAQYRNPKLSGATPIRVVNEVFTSGDGNRGVQTAAYNLPNDERVVKEKGSKLVILKNVQHEKFTQTLVPISRVVLAPAQRPNLSFDAFFTHILMHETVHGLGPHSINVGGRATTVRLQLKENHSAIEEAKADIAGLWALQYLIDKGVVDKGLERSLYTTYLASTFRSVRFGITEAHGKGIAVQFNYLMDKGAIRYDERTGTFSIDPAKVKDAVRDLTHDIMTLQAEGSYEKAKTMLDTYGVVRPPMRRALDRLNNVPVDIEPSYPLARAVSNMR